LQSGKIPRVGNIVRRGPAPSTIRRGKNFRGDALTSLLRDFDHRCAYCMQREAEDEGFKIDHHWPTSKGGPWTNYENLFLSCDRCNHHKHDWWPPRDQQTAGARFLNCCKEVDYGDQLFEDDQGHIVNKGTGGPGAYHIRMLHLNRPDLVRMRLLRKKLFAAIEEEMLVTNTTFDAASRERFLELADKLKELMAALIPRIPPHPG
jgi:hypothetical protein